MVDELELFLKDVENCREKLNEYNENLDEIEKQQKNILKVDWNAVARTAKTEVVEDLKNKNSVLQQEIAKVIFRIIKMLRNNLCYQCFQMIKKGYNTSLESQKQEIQKMQLESLKESFQESLTRATNMFEEHKEKSKKCLIKSCKIAGIKLSEEQIEEKIAENDLDLYSQGIIDQQAKKELDDTKKRHNEFLSLEESIRELYELFKQMMELVEIQGHTVDNIENNVGRAQIDVEKGVKDLAVAAINQTSARKKKIGLIALGVFVFFIIIIIISTQTGGDSRSNGVQPIVVIIKNNETGKVEIIESCDPMEDNCV